MEMAVHLNGTIKSSLKSVSAVLVEGFHVPIEFCDVESITVELNGGRKVRITDSDVSMTE